MSDYYVNREIETMSPDALAELQRQRLVKFLHSHVATNPWFSRHYTAHGVDILSIEAVDDLRRLPVMRKTDVIDDIIQAPPFGRRATIAKRDIRQFVETSGTTNAVRERYPLSSEDTDLVVEMEMYGFAWAGVGSGSIVASSLPLTTRAAGQWYYDAVRRLGGVWMGLSSYSTEKKLDYLREFRPHMLQASPSYLRRIEMVADDMGIDLRQLGVQSILTSGEPLSPGWLRARHERWGARCYEQYGSTQRAIAWTCELGALHDDSLGVCHTLPHLGVYEIVDPETGEEVADGESGELLITPFASTSSPLVRFASGDRVTKVGASECPCGRPFMGIRCGTVQRLDSTLKVRGVVLYEADIDSVLLREPVLEYQARVFTDRGSGREEIEIALECRADTEDRAALCERLERELQSRIGLRCNVIEHLGTSLLVEAVGEVAKRKRWSDERASSQTTTGI